MHFSLKNVFLEIYDLCFENSDLILLGKIHIPRIGRETNKN